MKRIRIFLLCLTAMLFLAGCGKTENTGIITGIFAPVTENILPDSVVRTSGLWPVEDGYACLWYTSPSNPAEGQESDYKLAFTHMDREGSILRELSLPAVSPDKTYACDSGVYFAALDPESGDTMLIRYSWEGEKTASVSLDTLGVSLPQNSHTLLMTETPEGIAYMYGKSCLLLDDQLTETGRITLPGSGLGVYQDGETLWVAYTEKGVKTIARTEGSAVAESFPLPERFEDYSEYDPTTLIACRDGWLYAWDKHNIIRWQIGTWSDGAEPVVEEYLSFVNSGVSRASIEKILLHPDGNVSLAGYRTDGSNSMYAGLYISQPDRELAEITCLYLITWGIDDDTVEMVHRFNRDNPDLMIVINDYARFDNAEDWRAGYKRMVMDVSNGLVQADMICCTELDSVIACQDLYPLMTGEVKPEDLWGCIRNTYEKDGALCSLPREFTLNGLVGKTEYLNGMTGWNMEEMLTWLEALPADVHVLDSFSRDDHYFSLSGWVGYHAFFRDGQADFDSPLYRRYLDYIITLPETRITYSRKEAAALAVNSMLAGGVETEIPEGYMENLYQDGTIRLYNASLQSLRYYLELFTVFHSEDITCIGYPVSEGSGMVLEPSALMGIPVNSTNPEKAWEFLEACLLSAGEEKTYAHDIDGIQEKFASVKRIAMAEWERYLGYTYFTRYTGGTQFEKDMKPDGDGRYDGTPGMAVVIDEDLLTGLENLLETAGVNGCGGTYRGIPLDMREILWDEEGRYLAGAVTAEECADNIQSRIGIYLAENS